MVNLDDIYVIVDGKKEYLIRGIQEDKDEKTRQQTQLEEYFIKLRNPEIKQGSEDWNKLIQLWGLKVG